MKNQSASNRINCMHGKVILLQTEKERLSILISFSIFFKLINTYLTDWQWTIFIESYIMEVRIKLQQRCMIK